MVEEADLSDAGIEAFLGIDEGAVQRFRDRTASATEHVRTDDGASDSTWPESKQGHPEAPVAAAPSAAVDAPEALKAKANVPPAPATTTTLGAALVATSISPSEAEAAATWRSHTAAMVAAMLPILPPGVDGTDPDVRSICVCLIASNGPVAGTEGLKAARLDLQRSVGELKAAELTTALLRGAAAEAEKAAPAAAAAIASKRASLLERRREQVDAAQALETFWLAQRGSSRSEFRASVAGLRAVHPVDWEQLRREKPPFLGDRRVVRAVSRCLELLCGGEGGWEGMLHWLSNRETVEERSPEGVDGRITGPFDVLLLAALDAEVITPYSAAAGSEVFRRVDDARKGFPEFHHDHPSVAAISPALTALVRFLLAFATHAREAKAAMPLLSRLRACQQRCRAAEDQMVAMLAEDDARRSGDKDASRKLTVASAAEETARTSVGRSVRLMLEARAIARLWYGDAGLAVLESDLPACDPAYTPALEATGARGQIDSYIPPLGALGQAAAFAVARDALGEAAGKLVDAAWELLRDDRTYRKFWYNSLTGDWRWVDSDASARWRRIRGAVRAGSFRNGSIGQPPARPPQYEFPPVHVDILSGARPHLGLSVLVTPGRA